MAVARSLVVDIAMNTAKISKDIERIRGSFDALGSTVTKIGGVLAAAFSVRAVINYADSLIDLGDELSKTSQKVGISVEKLSAYQYAAKLSNVSNEELTSSLAKLSKNIQEAVTDKGSEAAKMFETLGVRVKDNSGKVRELSSVFEESADKLSKVREDTAKTTVEMGLFGKSGYQLAPLLNSLKELTAEAGRTGKIISTDFAQAAERFNDELTRMKTSMDAFLTSSQQGAPILNALLTVLKSVQFVGIGVAQGFEELGTGIAGLAAAAADAAKLNLAEARATLKLMKEDIAEIQRRGEAAREALFSEKPIVASASVETTKPRLVLPEKTTGDRKTAHSDMEDAIRAENEISEGLTREGITRQTELIIAEEERRRQLKMEAVRLSIMDEDALAQEAFEKKLENIQRARDLEIISHDDKTKLIGQAELEHLARMGDMNARAQLEGLEFQKLTNFQKIQNVLQTGEDLTSSVATSSKTLFNINKSLALANAAVSLPDAVLQSFQKGGGYPWGLIPAGLMLIKGMAQIRAIKSASFGTSSSAPSVGGGGAIPVTNVGASSQPGPTGTQNLPSQNITINVQNGVGDKAYWQGLIDDVIVPGINDARDRNINLNIRTV